MSPRQKIGIAAACGMGITALAALVLSVQRARQITSLQGAVIRRDADVKEQTPIANAEVSVGGGGTSTMARTDGAGFFRLTLHPAAEEGDTIQLRARREGFEPLDLTTTASDRLYVLRMTPAERAAAARAITTIADVRVRYAVKTVTTANVGSTVKPFEIVNVGNTPCAGQLPCSPDGKWKARSGSASLDAGEGNQFRNARVSCIAGPCPFTAVIADGFSRGGRKISVAVLNWSDTVTYLLEAEVTRTMASDVIHYAYPAIFGNSLTFTLPAEAQGPSIEAEVNGSQIIFPLGPSLRLSWATCSSNTGADRTQAFNCELKPGYAFANDAAHAGRGIETNMAAR
ncbi:MAG TPA: carboxypeptidase-like regulatory domain-containing protein [Bryobacteraceae bacterium]|nr:carboxypeptidase-like regulatory domain-containing protein [Bryobacteraceae bacterium]